MKKIRKIKKNVIIPNPCHTGHSIRIALSLVVLLYLSLSPLRAQSDCTVERGIKTGPPTLVEAIPIPPSEPDTTTDTESNPPFEGDRLIFWIHGLGGSSDSWTRTANHTHENYRVTSLRPSYSQFTLRDAGQDLHQIFVADGDPHMAANGIEDPNLNFVICHSQGGLASKAADKYYLDLGIPYEERRFGGIVTFGTPHQGARILNSVPDIQAFLGESCVALKAGPQAELFQGNWLLDVLTNIGDPFQGPSAFEAGLDQLCAFIGTDVIPAVGFSGQLTPITEDFMEGSPVVDELNNYGATIPRVAFYGVEDDPVMWRTLKYFTPGNSANDFATFDANYDEDGVEIADENLRSYEAKMEAYHELFNAMMWDGCAWWKPWNNDCFDAPLIEVDPFGFTQWEAYDIFEGYLQGYQWWLTANEQYETFIGAREVDLDLRAYECTCVQYNQWDEPVGSSRTEVNHPDDCQPGNSLEECEYHPIRSFPNHRHVVQGAVL
ncbi:MAG: hypothetical protein AAFW73_21735, partial [Bacteroidota bacterium]